MSTTSGDAHKVTEKPARVASLQGWLLDACELYLILLLNIIQTMAIRNAC